MKLIEDGNLKGWVRGGLVVAGIGMVLGSALNGLDAVISKSVFMMGIIVAAVGGYASQAHMLKIKPFDNSYKKARESYKQKDDDDHSK
ncbi:MULTISPECIES: hypothetical protein [Burkholderia]|uniref:hypothetical protein n=1 Tax=Burkholderia TaxID=32008 RepID=UPI0011776E7A|nr:MULTISPECIES: hypothetical protein [Burkholderia]MBY4728874.1 hypothetical protein [Burkholderia contaminans]MCI3968254.1 hypothetical protein [Burkholderia sp. HI4860]MDN7788244.1 hypothetical protein [Burkholderia contaminans]